MNINLPEQSGSRLIRLSAGWLYFGIPVAVAGIAALIGGIWWIANFKEVSPRDVIASTIGLILIGLYFTVTGVWSILNVRYSFYLLESDQLTWTTFYSTRRIPFRDVNSLSWQGRHGRDQILLTADHSKISLGTFGLPINAQRHLILTLRRNIPLEKQERWDEFGKAKGRHILKKRKLPRAVIEQRKSAGELFTTRRKFDQLMIALVVLVTSLAVGLAWFAEAPRIAVGAIFIFFVWPLRWALPRSESPEGLIAEPKKFWPRLIIGVVLFALFAVILVHILRNPDQFPFFANNGKVIGFFVMSVVILMMYIPMIIATRKARKRLPVVKAEIAEEWRAEQERYHIRDEDLK